MIQIVLGEKCMSNISFIEISHREERRIWTNCNRNTFGFLATVATSDVSNGKDVTDDLLKGRYGLNSEYTILYLYDIKKDPESIEFLDEYGGQIHNITSSNINVLTYFTSSTISGWKNVYHRETLENEAEKDDSRVTDAIRDLKDSYNVMNLPSMVVIKKDVDDKEQSFIIDMLGYKKEAIHTKFVEVINVINDNCEEDIEVIQKKLTSSKTEIKDQSLMSNFNTFNYVENLIKAKRKFVSGYNQQSLSAVLGITDKTLRNKRTNNSFKRDECIIIGLEFSITVDELNRLLTANERSQLSDSGRDAVFLKCLKSKLSVVETNDELIDKGFSPLIRMDE